MLENPMTGETSSGQLPKQELLDRMRQGYNMFASLLRGIRPGDQNRALDGEWSVAEHIAHLASWEQLALAVLTGATPYEAMGITAEDWQQETDGINEALHRLHAGIAFDDARSLWQGVHASLVAAIEASTDAELARPMGAGADDPVSDLIVGNTYEHYEEHAGWIREKLGRV
jgi:hypothetical protein